MTYDKVQFTLKGHNYEQLKNIVNPLNYSTEGEKQSGEQVKQKHENPKYESELDNTREVRKKKSPEKRKNKHEKIRDCELHTGNLQLDIEVNETSVRSKKEKDKTYAEYVVKGTIRKEKEIKKSLPKYSITEMKPFEDKRSSSTKSRRSSESDVRSSNKSKSGKFQINEEIDNSEISDVFEDEQNSVPSVPKLNLGEASAYKRQQHKSSFTENNVTNGIGEYIDGTSKLPKIKCKHVLAGRDIPTKQNHNVTTKNLKSDTNKCMVCEITEATAKYASLESNRLLLEIVYPHEFYDKFQRSNKRAKMIRSQKQLDIAKEKINICKPVSVATKPWRREKTSQVIVTDRADPPNARCKPRERSEYDISPQKRIKTDGEHEVKKEIHLQCKAKDNVLVVTDDSEGQKLVLRGLRGWIMKKDDTCKNKMHKDIKKSLYQVNSLGMNFCIPEYNTSLSDRKLHFTRALTCIASPRQPETQQPIRKSVTQSMSPRNQVTFLNPQREVQSVPGMTRHSLQRSLTHVPKLFSDPLAEDSLKDFGMSKTATTLENNSLEYELSLHKENKKLSLPRIGADIKSRSLSFSQS